MNQPVDTAPQHTTLVMLAHAILTVIAVRERHKHTGDDHALIPLTVNEIRRLFAKLIANTIHPISHQLRAPGNRDHFSLLVVGRAGQR